MNRIFTLTLFIFLIKFSFCQNIDYSKVFINNEDLYGKSLTITKDTGVVVVFNSDPNYLNNSYLMSLNKNGDTNWVKSFFTNNGSVANVIVDEDSNFIASGYFNENNTNKQLIFKFDIEGNIVWGKEISENSTSLTSDKIYKISDSTYAVLGHSSNLAFQAISFIVLNKNGSILLSKLIETNTHLTGKSVFINNQGNYNITISKNDDSFFLLEIDNNGNILSQSNIFTNQKLINSQILNNNIYCLSKSNDKIFLSKFNQNIELISTKSSSDNYGENPNFEIFSDSSFIYYSNDWGNFGHILIIDSNGNIIRNGSSQFVLKDHDYKNGIHYFIGNGPTYGVKSFTSPQFCIIKDDYNYSQNNYLCYSLGISNSSFLDDTLFQINNPFLFNSLNLNSNNFSNFELTASEISYFNGCVYHYDNLENQSKSTFKIYPTITNGKINIEQENNEDFTLEILNNIGERVYTKKCFSTESEININQLNSGIYIYRITTDSNSFSTGKIVLER